MNEELSKLIETYKTERSMWVRKINENSLFHTKEEKIKAIAYAANLSKVISDLEVLIAESKLDNGGAPRTT